MDAQLGIVAYELLYRGLYGMAMATDIDPAAATSSVLVDAILELGVDRLVGDRPMHVNFPQTLLEGDAALGAPADPARSVACAACAPSSTASRAQPCRAACRAALLAGAGRRARPG